MKKNLEKLEEVYVSRVICDDCICRMLKVNENVPESERILHNEAENE